VRLTLDRPELNELVGLAPTARTTSEEFQKRLCALGVPFRVVGSRILVSRAVAEDWLRGQSVTKPAGGLRLDLVR
jgi:hypothetical protein